MGFNVEQCLEFIAYCAFRCNGTVLIAEIHRRVMSDVEKYQKLYQKCASMYPFLIAVNKEVSKTSPGSCTENCFTFSQGSNNTMWNELTQEFLSLCQLFYVHDDI